MKAIAIFYLLVPVYLFAQTDTSGLSKLGKETVLSEVVVRSDLNVVNFLKRVKEDTTFYKAFKNLHIIEYSSVNDIKMLNSNNQVQASLFSKTKQIRTGNCRSMQVLDEKTTGDIYKGDHLNYYTAELYAGLFFTKDKICGESNIVNGMELSTQGKSGIEKHKEQLKMLFFNPGKRIPGIPFIGNKIDIFDPSVSKYYDFSIDMAEVNGTNCYVFKIIPKQNLTASDKNNIVFDNITTWFNAKSMEIVARNYDLSYNTPVYDFNVHMEVQMTHFKGLLVPEILRYNGNWKVVFKRRERGIFTAILSDFN